MEKAKCPKCKGEMEEGFIADHLAAVSVTGQKWGTSTKLGGFLGVNDAHDVKTHRCKSCGYLESYAK